MEIFQCRKHIQMSFGASIKFFITEIKSVDSSILLFSESSQLNITFIFAVSLSINTIFLAK